MTRKSSLDETKPMPSHPSESGSGLPSTQQPPAHPEPIDTGSVHRHVRDTTGAYHHNHDDDGGI